MTTGSPSAGSRLEYVLPVMLLVAAGLSGIFDRDLWTPDEPRVAAISLEMSRSLDPVIPHLAGEPFVEEPPLYYAVAAASRRLLGFVVGDTGAIRFTSVLWGIGALAAMFLLARRFFPRPQAIAAVFMLAVMPGFVESAHWIRVDIALLFFVTAAMWCLSEALMDGRRWFTVAAGLFAAGAFLVKGIIGPGVIAFGWLALLAARLPVLRKGGIVPLLLPHLLAAILFACLAGGWALLLRLNGGPELWHEWFWTNHVGRLLGTEPQLGHLRPGSPLYYLKTIAIYTLPWTPLIALWAFRLVRDLFVRKTVSAANVFLLLWSAAILVVLSASVTKRNLYMLPILPAFALMGAGALGSAVPRWCRMFLSGWCILCLAVLSACAYSPLLAFIPSVSRHLHQALCPDAVSFLFTWTSANAIAGAFIAASLFVLFRVQVSRLVCTAAVTAAAVAGLFAIAGKAVDIEKDLGRDIRAFASATQGAPRGRIASWDFSETVRGSFYYYCDWSVPRLHDEGSLREVLAGRDPKYDSVVVSYEYGGPNLGGIPVETLAEMPARPGGSTRRLVWMKGAGPGKAAKGSAGGG
ncbi:MAG: glycosyltransferase family 39 protein [bacterium]